MLTSFYFTDFCLFSFKKINYELDAMLTSGADISTINALERVDNSTLASVNQLGQLKLWDLRTGLNKPQRRLLR